MIDALNFELKSTRFLDKCRARTRDRRVRRHENIARYVQDLVVAEWLPAVWVDGADSPAKMRRALMRRVKERMAPRGKTVYQSAFARKAGSLWLTLAMWILPIIIKWLIKRWWDKHGFNYDKQEPLEEVIVAIVKSEEFWGSRWGKAVKSALISAAAAILVLVIQQVGQWQVELEGTTTWWALPLAALCPWFINALKLAASWLNEQKAAIVLLAACGLSATWTMLG